MNAAASGSLAASKSVAGQSLGMDVLVLKTGAFGGLLTGRPEDLGVTG